MVGVLGNLYGRFAQGNAFVVMVGSPYYSFLTNYSSVNDTHRLPVSSFNFQAGFQTVACLPLPPRVNQGARTHILLASRRRNSWCRSLLDSLLAYLWPQWSFIRSKVVDVVLGYSHCSSTLPLLQTFLVSFLFFFCLRCSWTQSQTN